MRFKLFKLFLMSALVAFVTMLPSSCGRSGKSADSETERDSASESSLPEGEDSLREPEEKNFEWAREWKAGTRVEEDEIEAFGVDSCFVAEDISDKLFNRIDGNSFNEEGLVKREDLQHLRLIHYDAGGEVRLGEMICNRKIAPDLLKVFRALYESKYPIESVRLIDDFNGDDVASMSANNTSCFNYRKTSGGSKLSKHAWGMAVDINPLYNPYVKKSAGQVLPPEGKPYLNRDSVFLYKIDKNDMAYKEFTKRGFKWGGSWRTLKDYQHFQK